VKEAEWVMNDRGRRKLPPTFFGGVREEVLPTNSLLIPQSKNTVNHTKTK